MLNSEIIPTRCNNALNTQHSEKQHCITRQCYLQLNTTDNDKTTRILTKLQHKYTCLPERPYTAALYSWWWVELSPETCRVKPLRRINAIVASCWIYFTSKNVVQTTYLLFAALLKTSVFSSRVHFCASVLSNHAAYIYSSGSLITLFCKVHCT